MGLHRRLGDIEFIGNLLVEETCPQHHQHAHLLRREGGEALGEIVDLALLVGQLLGDGRGPDLAFENGRDSAAHLLGRGRFRNEAGGAQRQSPADHGGLFLTRDDGHRHGGKLRAEIGKAREPLHARHLEIEQHEIAIPVVVEDLDAVVEARGLAHRGVGEHTRQRALHGIAEQGVVIDDDDLAVVDALHRLGLPFGHSVPRKIATTVVWGPT